MSLLLFGRIVGLLNVLTVGRGGLSGFGRTGFLWLWFLVVVVPVVVVDDVGGGGGGGCLTCWFSIYSLNKLTHVFSLVHVLTHKLIYVLVFF